MAPISPLIRLLLLAPAVTYGGVYSGPTVESTPPPPSPPPPPTPKKGGEGVGHMDDQDDPVTILLRQTDARKSAHDWETFQSFEL